MGCKANNRGIRQDGDEDLGPEKLISSRYLKWLSETSQTSGQSMEDLIEDHLSCAVILQKQEEEIMTWKLVDLSHAIIHGPGLSDD